jgi:CRISPR system Cascade subunit CasA
MDSPSFNLVDDPWVPVVEDGIPRRVSLLDALGRAHEIDALATAAPLETVAILRQVLLPVYLDACAPPNNTAEWAGRWKDRVLPAGRIKEYLGEHHALFDLFGGQPFGQVYGLRTEKGEIKPVSLMIAAAATGNNVPLFSARTEGDPAALAPDEAVRALLAAQCWDTAAIKSGAVGDSQAKAGKTTGNPTGPLGGLGVTVPVGRTLAETILLNTPILRHGLDKGDLPQWRRPAATAAWASRPAVGLLDLLTWQSRRIRLVPEHAADGRVVVRQVVLAAGDRLTLIPTDQEPHTAWRQVEKRKPGQPPVMPVRHRPGHDAWRGLKPMLATIPKLDEKFTSSRLLTQINDLRVDGYLPDDLSVQVLTVGVTYGNQFAVVEDASSDLIPLPVLSLDPESRVRRVLDTVIVQTEGLQLAANRLGDGIRAASGADKLPWDKGQRLGDALLHQFTPVLRRLLAGLQQQPDEWERWEDNWRRVAGRLAFAVAETALASVPPTAFLGRVKDGRSVRESVVETTYRSRVRKILGLETSDL